MKKILLNKEYIYKPGKYFHRAHNLQPGDLVTTIMWDQVNSIDYYIVRKVLVEGNPILAYGIVLGSQLKPFVKEGAGNA